MKTDELELKIVFTSSLSAHSYTTHNPRSRGSHVHLKRNPAKNEAQTFFSQTDLFTLALSSTMIDIKEDVKYGKEDPNQVFSTQRLLPERFHPSNTFLSRVCSRSPIKMVRFPNLNIQTCLLWSTKSFLSLFPVVKTNYERQFPK